jgi:predicted transcriptional regulator
MAFVSLYPTPSIDGKVTVSSTQKHDLQVFDASGKLVFFKKRQNDIYEIILKNRGVYVFHFITKKGQIQTEKVVFQ